MVFQNTFDQGSINNESVSSDNQNMFPRFSPIKRSMNNYL